MDWRRERTLQRMLFIIESPVAWKSTSEDNRNKQT